MITRGTLKLENPQKFPNNCHPACRPGHSGMLLHIQDQVPDHVGTFRKLLRWMRGFGIYGLGNLFERLERFIIYKRCRTSRFVAWGFNVAKYTECFAGGVPMFSGSIYTHVGLQNLNTQTLCCAKTKTMFLFCNSWLGEYTYIYIYCVINYKHELQYNVIHKE